MANRRSSPPPPQAPQRTAAHMLNDISRIQRCIGELQGFDLTTVRDRSDPRIRSLEVSISQVLTQAFGGDGPERRLYDAAASLDRAPLRMGVKTPLQEVVQGLARGKEQAIELLNRAITALEDKIADLGEAASQEPAVVSTELSKDVFIVHDRPSAPPSHLRPRRCAASAPAAARAPRAATPPRR